VTEAFGQVLEADHGNVFIGGGSGGGKAELKAQKAELVTDWDMPEADSCEIDRLLETRA
jgi:hypothetical protein